MCNRYDGNNQSKKKKKEDGNIVATVVGCL